MSDISIAGSLIPTTTNTPLDKRSNVATLDDVATIENPILGGMFYCVATGKHYRITSLKSKKIGVLTVPDAQVDTYEELPSKSDITTLSESITTIMGLLHQAGIVETINGVPQISSSIPEITQTTNAGMYIPKLEEYPTADTIVYITPDGTGDGSSWENAYNNFYDAITNSPEQTTFYVEEGEYPAPSNLFFKKNSIVVGGFSRNDHVYSPFVHQSRIIPYGSPTQMTVGDSTNGTLYVPEIYGLSFDGWSCPFYFRAKKVTNCFFNSKWLLLNTPSNSSTTYTHLGNLYFNTEHYYQKENMSKCTFINSKRIDLDIFSHTIDRCKFINCYIAEFGENAYSSAATSYEQVYLYNSLFVNCYIRNVIYSSSHSSNNYENPSKGISGGLSFCSFINTTIYCKTKVTRTNGYFGVINCLFFNCNQAIGNLADNTLSTCEINGSASLSNDNIQTRFISPGFDTQGIIEIDNPETFNWLLFGDWRPADNFSALVGAGQNAGFFDGYYDIDGVERPSVPSIGCYEKPAS